MFERTIKELKQASQALKELERESNSLSVAQKLAIYQIFEEMTASMNGLKPRGKAKCRRCKGTGLV